MQLCELRYVGCNKKERGHNNLRGIHSDAIVNVNLAKHSAQTDEAIKIAANAPFRTAGNDSEQTDKEQ
jgi:hypothetical protein